MSDSFLQKPWGVASLIGGAILGPYLLVGDHRSPLPHGESHPASNRVNSSTEEPIGLPTAMLTADLPPVLSVADTNFIHSGGVQDLREILRFDIHPSWIAQRFPQVTTVLADTRLDGQRVAFVSGIKATDIAGSLTYYFDATEKLRRLQFHGTTGDPSMLVSLMTQFYYLKPEVALGSEIFMAKWNNRITSLMQLTSAAILNPGNTNRRYQVFLELNHPSEEYGLSLQAEQLLQSARLTQRW